MKKLLFVGLLLASSATFAQTTSTAPVFSGQVQGQTQFGGGHIGGMGGLQHPRNPQIEAALQACASTVQKDPTTQRPNREQMHACMEQKGFKRPEHAPGQFGGPRQGNQGNFQGSMGNTSTPAGLK